MARWLGRLPGGDDPAPRRSSARDLDLLGEGPGESIICCDGRERNVDRVHVRRSDPTFAEWMLAANPQIAVQAWTAAIEPGRFPAMAAAPVQTETEVTGGQRFRVRRRCSRLPPTSSEATNGGQGLGPARVKRLASLLRLIVAVRSVVSKGSVFSLMVPRKPALINA